MVPAQNSIISSEPTISPRDRSYSGGRNAETNCTRIVGGGGSSIMVCRREKESQMGEEARMTERSMNIYLDGQRANIGSPNDKKHSIIKYK
jgi:hypothetical protein